MPTIGANVAIMRDGKILLTKREDFHVWCLPGGHIDPGETFPQCAVREAREETGLEVALTRLVGVYSRPSWGEYHILLFAAKITGGTEYGQPGEVIDIGFFGRDELPNGLLLGHRQRVVDTFDARHGTIFGREDFPLPFGRTISREELYRLRDASGLARADYYHRHFAPLEVAGSVLDDPLPVGGANES